MHQILNATRTADSMICFPRIRDIFQVANLGNRRCYDSLAHHTFIHTTALKTFKKEFEKLS